MFKKTIKHYKRIGSSWVETKFSMFGITLYTTLTEY